MLVFERGVQSRWSHPSPPEASAGIMGVREDDRTVSANECWWNRWIFGRFSGSGFIESDVLRAALEPMVATL